MDYCLRQINPLSGFRIESGQSGSELVFSNLGAEQGIAQPEAYHYRWFRFDNASRDSTPIGEISQVCHTRIPLPAESAPYRMLRIRTLGSGIAGWEEPVEVFIRTGTPETVVGIDWAPRPKP